MFTKPYRAFYSQLSKAERAASYCFDRLWRRKCHKIVKGAMDSTYMQTYAGSALLMPLSDLVGLPIDQVSSENTYKFVKNSISLIHLLFFFHLEFKEPNIRRLTVCMPRGSEICIETGEHLCNSQIQCVLCTYEQILPNFAQICRTYSGYCITVTVRRS